MWRDDEAEVWAVNATNDPLEFVYVADTMQEVQDMDGEDLSLGQCRECGSGGLVKDIPPTYLPDYGIVDDGHVMTGHALISSSAGSPYARCGWCGLKSFLVARETRQVIF